MVGTCRERRSDEPDEGGGGTVVGTPEGSAGSSMGVGTDTGRVVGGTDEASVGVETIAARARTDGGPDSADAKARLPETQIRDSRSPESTRRFQFVMSDSLRYLLTQEVESSTNVSSAANLASMNWPTS